ALLGLQAKNWVAQQNRSSFVDDREYLFTNDLVRESAYKVLTKIQRVSEHRRTADWLESKVGDRTEEFTELLAYHYGQSSLQAIGEDGENEDALRKAGTYGWRAAERARTQQAYTDALSRYNDAMTLFQRLLATNEHTDLQLDGLSAEELRLEVQLRRAQVKEPLGQLDSAVEDLDAVLQTALPANRIRQAAAAYTQKGRVLRLQSHGAEAMECAEKAIELFKQAGDPGGQAQALLSLGEMYSDVPRLADFEAACRQAHELAQQAGVRWLEARALTLLGSACVYQGKMAEGLESLQQSVEINQALSDRRGLASTALLTGRVLQASGRSHEAIQRCEQAYAIFHELGEQPMRIAALSTLGQLHLEKGNLTAARDYSGKGVVLAKTLGQSAQQVRCLLLLAQAELSEGQGQAAVDRLLEAKDICEQSDQPAILPEVYRMLAQAYVAVEQPGEAERFALLGREVVDDEDHYSQGTTWFALALVNASIGRVAEAEDAFHHALEDLDAAEESYEIGEANLEYGQFLMNQSRREQAKEHLQKARAAFSDLETQDRLQRIDALLEQLE
ncbi:MAG: tetratricopeptide repeat protein, partial [Chloroflexota bacterium]